MNLTVKLRLAALGLAVGLIGALIALAVVLSEREALARAHYESRNQLLARANATLTRLRRQMLAMLGLLFVFGVALALLAYRDLIVPLRVKLVESQSLVERNENRKGGAGTSDSPSFVVRLVAGCLRRSPPSCPGETILRARPAGHYSCDTVLSSNAS